MRAIFWVLVLSAFSHLPAYGADCLDNNLVINKELHWDLSNQQSIDFFLPSHNSNNTFLTKAALHMQPTQLGYAQVYVDFATPLMSNSYNLYKLEITIGNATYSEDLTFNCEQHGRSIYPGQFIMLPNLPLPADPGLRVPVHIKVWGHL